LIKDSKGDCCEKSIIKNTNDSRVLRQNVIRLVVLKCTTNDCPHKFASSSGEILMHPLVIANKFNS